MQAIERNTKEHGIRFFGLGTEEQGIVHIIGPELGLTQPGMTIACGDSHTSTHGALGSLAFGVGTSQIRDILATQTLVPDAAEGAADRGVRRARRRACRAKDLIIRIIADLGVNGGIGFAYEYGGPAIAALPMEARLTLCNMSIEAGARAGYVNPDEIDLRLPQGQARSRRRARTSRRPLAYWKSIASDPDAALRRRLQAGRRLASSRWSPGASTRARPWASRGGSPGCRTRARRTAMRCARPTSTPASSEDSPLQGLPVDVAFIGSCTNGRISDLREAARVVKGQEGVPRVKALVVPGSRSVARQAEAEGLAGDLPRRRLRVARGGLLDVPGHEPRQAHRPAGVRELVEPELHRPAGLAAAAARSS